jgi:hypothetical protein
MMNIESQRVIVAASNTTIFEFLSVPQNIYELLPQDKVSDFKADEKSCSFKVQGGFTITLVQDELTPYSRLKMIAGEKSPFPFDLTIHIEEIDAQTVGYISFNGEVNAFLKMMVQKPLTNLFNYMSVKLQEKYA